MAIRPFGVADIDFRLCICQTHHNHFNSEQIGISPCQLSLHAAGGRTADQVLFDAHQHDDHGDDGKNGRRITSHRFAALLLPEWF